MEEAAHCGVPQKGTFCPQPLLFFLLSGCYEVSFFLLHTSAMMGYLIIDLKGTEIPNHRLTFLLLGIKFLSFLSILSQKQNSNTGLILRKITH